MATQKFMGRGQLLERLTAQVGSKKLAVEILQKRGHLMPNGKDYTMEGMIRNSMTAEERAKDRYFKKTGKSIENLKYNPVTNSVKNF
jgi:hypothetical protein